MNKFKIGDKIRRIGNRKIIRVVNDIPGTPSYDAKGFLNPSKGFLVSREGLTIDEEWSHQDDWELDEINPRSIHVGSYGAIKRNAMWEVLKTTSDIEKTDEKRIPWKKGEIMEVEIKD